MREVARCSALTQQGLAAEMTVVNYRANQTAFYNHVMIVPVFGGFENGGASGSDAVYATLCYSNYGHNCLSFSNRQQMMPEIITV